MINKRAIYIQRFHGALNPCRYFPLLILGFLLLLFIVGSAEARPAGYNQIQTGRFILYLPNDDYDGRSFAIPANAFLKTASTIMADASRIFQKSFSLKINSPVILRVVPSSVFFKQKKAPKWAKALYKNGEILIPESKARSLASTKLKRILRHEYAHAVVAKVAMGRCPVWMDEGIAQLVEGSSSAQDQRLRNWIRSGTVIPFDFLRTGFVFLNKEKISSAYAQSLFAVNLLKRRHGLKRIATYLRALRFNPNDGQVFQRIFGQTVKQFEDEISQQINKWSAKAKIL